MIDRRAYIVEDDSSLRNTIRRILTGSGIYTEEFGSAEAFLCGYGERPLGCVLLDMQLPGKSGLELLANIRPRAPANPVIILSGRLDIPTAVSAVRAGAMEVLEKPFRKERLLDTVDQAFRVISLINKSRTTDLTALTPREEEVLRAFSDASPTKVVAARLGLSARTVEMYRAVIVKKLGMKNMTQALLLAKENEAFGLYAPRPEAEGEP
ncbi:MAG TPA: response regulator [Allosphingosinicella sp.]